MNPHFSNFHAPLEIRVIISLLTSSSLNHLLQIFTHKLENYIHQILISWLSITPLAHPISISKIDCTMKTCSIKTTERRLKKQLQCFHRGTVVVKKKKKKGSLLTSFSSLSSFFGGKEDHQVWLLMDSLMQVGLKKASIWPVHVACLNADEP